MFSEAAKSFGHFTIQWDLDGYARRMPLIVEYDGKYYPALDLEIVRAYLNPPMPPIIYALGAEGGGSVNLIQVGDRSIQTDEQGHLLINFYGGPGTFPRYSLSDIIRGDVPSAIFKDKIVLVGFTANIYQDLYPTSFAQAHYGVEIHTNIIENLLRQDFLTRPEALTLIDALIIFLLGIGLGIVLHKIYPWWGIIHVRP
jgi:adenylate cyclase